MPRETPRTQAEIDAELDEWLSHKAEQLATLSGLTESFNSLQTLVQGAGTSQERAALTTRLNTFETELAAVRAELKNANATITALRGQLPSPPPPPVPKPAGDPPAPSDPSDRKTRTGLTFL